MQFKGDAKRLESIDISRLAHTIGCGEDHLHAVMEVETRGGGFDNYGRIKMLFEPHVFYSELSGSERQEAISAGLAYRRWGEKTYPSDSYSRLQHALAINADAALRSCSWGLGQIMGFNHKIAGYSSAAAMVEAFRDDEDTHLAAMVEFIVGSGLDDELRAEDWRGFARGYNGAGYAKHGYHTKLKRAYDKWCKIPDTPFTIDNIDQTLPDPNPPAEVFRATRGKVLKWGMIGADVEMLQGTLAMLGFPVGKKDGKFFRQTHRAVVAFQSEQGLVVDGEVGELTWEALDTARETPKRKHTVASLRDDGSSTIKTADAAETQTKVASAGIGGLGILQVGKDALTEVSGAGGILTQAQDVLVSNWPIIAVLAIAAVAYFKGPKLMQAIKDIRVRDAVSGEHLGR
ncbi:MAG: N-acetylmuramidase domain-containing protein [Sulfitobacter sp.]